MTLCTGCIRELVLGEDVHGACVAETAVILTKGDGLTVLAGGVSEAYLA